MTWKFFRTLGCFVTTGLFLTSITAAENPSATELAGQLGDRDFSVRESAARELEKAGAAAIPALVDAAVNGDAEAKQRALNILKRLGTDSDEAIVAALNEVVESGPEASAEVARSVLKLVTNTRSGEIPPDQFKIPGMDMEFLADGVRFKSAGGGIIQMGRKGGAGIHRSMLKTGDGVSLIVGNSDKTQVVIAILPSVGIKMQVTAEADGSPVTRAFQYRNEEEFLEKNPELFALFEQFREGR